MTTHSHTSATWPSSVCSFSKKHLLLPLSLAACLGFSAAHAASIAIPNASFESPSTTFVDINIGAWQKQAKPAWYDESGGFYWVQLSGAFANTAPTAGDHIDNMDGSQGVYLFAVPQASLYQDLTGPVFEVGQSFDLTVGVIGGGGGMAEGSVLELQLYYRDAGNNMVTVATKPISFSAAAFPTTTHLIDFQLNVPAVLSTAAWAGKAIGVQVLSDGGTNGGYWDVDNVRLSSNVVPEPGSLSLLALGSILLAHRPSRRRA